MDCFLKANSQYKNLLGTDYIELITIKAQGNAELNQKLNQAIKGIDAIGKFV